MQFENYEVFLLILNPCKIMLLVLSSFVGKPIHSHCLDETSEDRLLYLMMGPGLPLFCDHWLCVLHFGEFMMV